MVIRIVTRLRVLNRGARRRCMDKPRLMDRLREAIRVRHYSWRTEEAYRQWVRHFDFFMGKDLQSRWARPRSRPFSPTLRLIGMLRRQPRIRRCRPSCFFILMSSVVIWTDWKDNAVWTQGEDRPSHLTTLTESAEEQRNWRWTNLPIP